MERILGIYLALEIGGMSDELATFVLLDPSPHVKAEAADWLYLHSQFDAWKRLVSVEAASLTRDKAHELFAKLAPGANTLEPPAVLALLHLGDGLPGLATELLKRSGAAVDEARAALIKPGKPFAEPLFDALHRANPANFDAILADIIRGTEDDAPVRWKAIWTLGETSMAAESAEFLKGFVSAKPGDPLTHKMTEAAGKIEARSQSGLAPISRLEAELVREFLGNGKQDDRTLSLVGYYVEWARRERPEHVNPAILHRASELLTSRPLQDQSLRRRLADIGYLLWRSAGA
ncbi:MAG: hypothetical protein HYY24_18455 [Verrucomicrobia bacterium]|nr:hypothetical protein [Verrucomicrobiota bacterium]